MNALRQFVGTCKKMTPDFVRESIALKPVWFTMDTVVDLQEKYLPTREDRLELMHAQEAKDASNYSFVTGMVTELATNMIHQETVVEPELRKLEDNLENAQYRAKLQQDKDTMDTIVSLLEKDVDGKLLLAEAREYKAVIESSPELLGKLVTRQDLPRAPTSNLATTERELDEMKDFIIDVYSEAKQIYDVGYALEPSNNDR